MIMPVLSVLFGGVLTTSNFLDGTFEDGYGVSLYVTPEGELTTLGNDWDLNDDGWLDIVIINEFFWDVEQIPETFSYIFWGGPEGFKRAHCDSFKTDGAECAALADFDRDGWTDIVVADSKSDYSQVIYGSSNGYNSAKTDSFRAKENHGSISVADFNRDGWLDLVWSNWLVWGDGNSQIYWGAPGGFDKSNTQSLPAAPTHGNIVADFDNDGYADILWAVYYTWGQIFKRDCLIFWGASDGFNASRVSKLEGAGPGDDISVADLNNDGFLDFVIPNRSDKPPPVERFYDYSYIYYGSGNRIYRKDSLYAYGPWGSSIADLNRDGWLDIVFACSADEKSLIYYGSNRGFIKTESLPEKGITSTYIADFDKDADLDMVLGKQESSQLSFYSHDESGWKSFTWYGVGGVDAGITRDLGSPKTREDEAYYTSAVITATSSPDSIAILDSMTVDFLTTWQGTGQPEGAGLDIWISSSPYPYGTDCGEWLKADTLYSGDVAGRAFLYRLCFHTGFVTSVFVRNVELYTHVEGADDEQHLPKIVQLSQRQLAVWMGRDYSHHFLSIFDVSGRRVRILHLDSSGYTFLDGCDDSGEPLPSGIYFLVAPQGGKVFTHKFVLY